MNLKAIIIFILVSILSVAGGKAQIDSLSHISKFGKTESSSTFLIINSYNENSPWTRSVIGPVTYLIAGREELRAELFNLNSTMITDSETYEHVRKQFLNYYSKVKVDYVAFIGQMAFTFREEVKEMWGDIPMLLVTRDLTVADPEFYFSGDKDTMEENDIRTLKSLTSEYNFTTIYLPDYYKETIDLMVDMIPDMEELVFFSDVDYYNRHMADYIDIYLMEEYPGIKYKWVEASEGNDLTLQYYLSHRAPNTGLLLSNWFYEKHNALGYPSLVMGALRLLFSSVNPIFSLRYAFMNLGSVGGVFSDPEIMNNDITQTINDILEGTSPRDIEFYYNIDKQPCLSYPLMQKYGLNSARCPADTIFLDKPLSFWQKYYWQMIVGTLILIMGVFVFVRRSIAQRQEIEILKRHKKFVDTMPVPYAKAKVKYNMAMEVVNIEYTSYNEAFEEIIKNNRDKSKSFILFPRELISEKTTEMLKTNEPLSFMHYFPKSNSYYQITLCIIDTKKKEHREYANLIDIFAVDFTKNFKDEKHLRELTQRLDLSLSMANIIPWEWDLPKEMMYFEATDLFRRYDNRHAGSDPVKKNWMAEPYPEYVSMIVKEDREKLRKVKEQLLLGTIDEFHIEYRLNVARQGKNCIEWMDINGAVSERDSDGRPIKVIGSSLVTTERKNQELELIDAAEKASYADKMKTLFISNLGREIRTPLSAIVKYSELICEAEDRNMRRHYQQIVMHNNEVLRLLIHDMLAFAEHDADDLDVHETAVNVNALIKVVGESVRESVPRDVSLKFTFGQEHCFAVLDSHRVAQVFMNIVNTACRLTSVGSITIGYELVDRYIRFFVRDTGTGTGYDDHPDLFDNNEDYADVIKNAEDLGLAKSVSLVEYMGGYVGVESHGESEGSYFWFNIPYEPVEVDPDKIDEDVVEPMANLYEDEPEDGDFDTAIPEGPPPLILVAEEVESNYKMIRDLIPQDIEVVHASNGQEAVEMCDRYKPDMVFMDLNMPGINGYEALDRIRRSGNGVPVIAIGAYVCAPDRKRILSSGFDDLISMPFTAEAIDAVISRFI